MCSHRHYGGAGEASDGEDDFLAGSTATLSLEPTSLMTIPPEVRLHIYRILFQASEPITLKIDPNSGYILYTREAKLSLQFLRVCKGIYLEACPLLYGINFFSIQLAHIPKLTRFRQASAMCVEKLKVHTGSSNLDGTPRNVDLSTIGQALPYLRKLEILAHKPSALLQHALKLTRSLPCSPIREWPLLEIIVEVPSEYEAGRDVDELVKIHDDHLKKKFSLDAFQLNSSSILALGHEMPVFPKIELRGQLSSRLCKLLENHVSTFGDCRFEKEVGPISPLDDSVTGVLKEFRYTWRRTGGEPVPKTKQDINVLSDMHRWVAPLSKEWYTKLLDSGYNAEGYNENEPFARAANRRRNEESFPSKYATNISLGTEDP